MMTLRSVGLLALSILLLQAANPVLAEGSRTLFPQGYFSGEPGNANPAATRSRLYHSNDIYLGVIRQRNFFYVYAEQGEFILLGTSGARNALRLFAPPTAGQSLQDRFGTPGLEDASALGAALGLSGTGCTNASGNISSRAGELAGPNSANNTVTVPNGYAPCYFQVPVGGTGIYGVYFGASNVDMWDVTVRSSATSITDINGRLFSYSFAGDTQSESNGTYATHYYITDDGYRYAQTFRGLAPYRYVLYSNPQGFLDVNGDPLYKNVRGQGHSLNSLASGSYFRPAGTGIQAERPRYPMFFTNVVDGSVDTPSGLQATLNALNIPLTPAQPVALSASFSNASLSGSRTYLGQGGVFTISTENALTYQIVIKGGNTPAHDDPAHPDNRVLTGRATGLNQQVWWDGRTNSGTPMPAGGNYTFEATGRAGEVHFPFLDAESNLNGGPTVTRLNGVGAGESTVYYDDRGYTTNGVDVGTPNGNICGAGGPSNAPTPSHSLLGVDSSDADLNGTGRYYRSWGAAPNTGNSGNDCAGSGYYGDAKGMDLWALIRSSPPPGVLTVEILDLADVTVNASIPQSVAPGGTVIVAATFGNVGSSTAQNVGYSIQLPPALVGGIACTGATCSYDSTTGHVSISGLPLALSAGQWTNAVTLQYTAPASGTLATTVAVTTTSTQTTANAPDSASGNTLVDSGGTVADVLAQVSAPLTATAGGTVNVAMTFSNLGPLSATAVTYAVTLSPDLTGVSCSLSASCAYDSTTGAVTVTGLPATLAAGATASTVLSYTAPGSGAVSVSATVATSTPESSSSNNGASAVTMISSETGADVTASIAPPASALGGTAIDIPMTFRNLGPGVAGGISYTVTLPTGIDGAVSCSAPYSCAYNSTTGALTLTGMPATLQNGQIVNVTATLTTPPNGTLSFNAAIATSATDSNLANNAVSAQTVVTPATHTVSFDSNGGTAVADLTNVTHGTTIAAPTPPTRVGYDFGGWYRDAALTTAWNFASDTVTAATTLYARWNVSVYALSYTAGPNGSITGASPQAVNHGGNGTAVTAVPNAGYHFVSWSDGVATATRTDTNVTASLAVTATFAINTYTLTYSAGVNGTLTGTTTQTVNHGANATAVTAVPNAGYHFVSWSDGVTTATRADTNVTGALTVSATFAINTYTLTYSAGVNGTLTGTTTQTVHHGANATAVTAVPNAGYHFVSWSDGVTTATRTDTNVTGALTVTATFAINTYTLTYSAAANGTLTGTTTQTVNHGANATAVTAVPNTGYHFVSWSDGVTTATRSDTNVTGALTVTATFAINTYTLTYAAGANGTLTGTASQTVNHGSDGTAVTAVPNTGYHFVTWSDGVTSATRIDTNVTSAITVTASFAIDSYTLSYTAGAHGTLTGTTTQSVDYGGSGTAVTAVPNAGYHFISWSDGVTTATRTDSNVTASLAVTASFDLNTYTLNYSAGANGTLTGAASQTVAHGASATTVTAVPNDGYHFTSWSDGVTTATRTDANVTSDLSVSASFIVGHTLTYTASGHGTLQGATSQSVPQGGSGTAVTAVPNTGFEFFRWSDGIASATRVDSNVTESLDVIAYFSQTQEHSLRREDERTFDVPSGSTLSRIRITRGGRETTIDDPAPSDHAELLTCSATTCRFFAGRSGLYELTFVDPSGNAVIIVFTVHPNVGFSAERQRAGVGMPVQVRAVLDDLPIDDRVQVGYSIQNGEAIASPEPSDLLTRNPQHLVFNVSPSGHTSCFAAGQCFEEISFMANVSTGEIRFSLHDSAGVVIGDYATHTVELTAAASHPLTADLVLLPGSTVTSGTPITASIVNLPAGQYRFDWSGSDAALGIGSGSGATVTSNVPATGNYLIRVLVQDLANPNRPAIELQVWVRIIAAGDGALVCGAAGCDDDGSGIPFDRQTPRCGLGIDDPAGALPYRLQVGVKGWTWGTEDLCLETQPGYGLRLGTVSFLSSPDYGAGVERTSIQQFGNNGAAAGNTGDRAYTHIGLYYDFEVTSLDTAGQSVAVVIPLPRNLTIPAGAVWRKYHTVDGWSTFNVDARNKVYSARRSGDGCPSPVSTLWDEQPGLIEGMNCVRLVIQDGGPNDADGKVNAAVADPGVLAVAAAQEEITVTSSGPKGGGGAMSPLALLLAALLLLRRHARTLVSILTMGALATAAQAGDADNDMRGSGWSVGVAAAQARGEVDGTDVTRGLTALGIPATASVKDQHRFGWRAFAGYRFGKYVSVDGGYTNLGKATTRITGVPLDLEEIPGVLPASGAGWELSATGYLPINEQWDVYARFGAWRWKTLYHALETGQERRPQASGSDPLGGLGLRYWHSDRWQAGLSWDRYRVDTQDVDLVGLNVIFCFGRDRRHEQ